MAEPFLPPVFLPDPINRHHPLGRDLISLWLTVPGLDGGRQWFDTVGLNHGVLTSMDAASGWRGTTRPGGWGHLLFDGSNDKVACGNSASINISPPLTVAAWIRPARIIGVVLQYFVTKGFGGGAGWGFGLDGTFTGTAKLFVYNGGVLAYGGTALSVGEWVHACAVMTGSDTTVYTNGKAAVTTSQAIATAANQPVIGDRDDASFPFQGSIDDAGFWGRAFSAVEVRTLYDESREGYPGLLRRWLEPIEVAPFLGYIQPHLPPNSRPVPRAVGY